MASNLESRRPRVVIVGAGFGGLFAAQALARAPADVTIIDRHNYHLFQPLLYQVATAGLPPSDIAWPVRSILRRQRNTTVLLGEVTSVDLEGRCVRFASQSLRFDYLVLATGSTHSYFGHEQWRAIAPGLKSIDDATLIRRKILLAFEAAEEELDPAARARLLRFVIVGAGPTGVELAGTIAELARHTLAADFRRIDPRNAQITLVEAGPRVLAAFQERQSAYAQRALEQLGVEVRLNARSHRLRHARSCAWQRAHRVEHGHLGRGRRSVAGRQVAREPRSTAPGASRCAATCLYRPTRAFS